VTAEKHSKEIFNKTGLALGYNTPSYISMRHAFKSIIKLLLFKFVSM